MHPPEQIRTPSRRAAAVKPGAVLQAERRRQEKSIDDIAEITRIPTTSLRLLEEGRVNDLPNPTIARGFMGAYARALGIDPKSLIGEPKAGSWVRTPPPSPVVSKSRRPRAPTSRGVHAALIVIALLALVVALAVVFGWLLGQGSADSPLAS